MERYNKQIILPEFGIQGQKLISSSSVLIIGAGGLGSIVCSYLASMGVGKIGICDFDRVEESNLHRQFFYSPSDINAYKAEVLTTKLSLHNPNIEIFAIAEKLQKSNVSNLISDFEIICDCSDNVATRLLINKSCSSLSKILIHGAVSDWQGYLSVFHYQNKFSLTDLFDTIDFLKSESCDVVGINSPICGIIGSHMANEVIKVILNIDSVLEGTLLYINGLTNISKYLKFKMK